jgi:teichoic acid transport system permease protein
VNDDTEAFRRRVQAGTGVSILTTAVATGPDSDLSAAQLAARYGLSVAGSRPDLWTYTRKLWAYRHFITHYAAAGLVAAFGKARLGRLWQLLTPLCNAGVYYLIFGVILNTKRGIHDYISWLILGVFIFNSTRAIMSDGVISITRNLGLIRALHFPRACLPIAATVGEFKDLVVSMLLMICIALGFGERPGWSWFMLIPVLILQAIFNTGLAMFMARLGNQVLDVKQLLPFVTRTWMYASGVIYAATRIPDALGDGLLGKLILANPLVVYIQLARMALLNQPPSIKGMPPHRLWELAIFWAVAMVSVGYVYFWLGEREYGRG